MQPAKATCAWIAAAITVALSAGCDPKAPKIQASSAPTVAAPPAVTTAANGEPHALPDFSALVEAVAPAIVNIKAISEVDAEKADATFLQGVRATVHEALADIDWDQEDGA